MRKLFSGCAILLLGLLAPFGLDAATVLVFQDMTLGTSVIPGALALWGGCGTCTNASDTLHFKTLLAGGGWDVVIYAEQNNPWDSETATAMTQYVGSGGRVIGQTWLAGGLSTLLEATGHGTNGTTITTTAHPIFTGFAGAILLSNPGWTTTFSRGWDPVGSATGLGTSSSGGSAVILGNGGHTILNAGLTDTYSPLADGERLLANELAFLAGQDGQVPEPSTWAAMGLGLAALVLKKFRAN